MGGLFGFDDEDKKEAVDRTEDRATMRLREEELDVSKHAERTGEVTLHKDVVEETRSVTVPVSHEEVVVERRAVSATPSDEPIGEEETIRIPVSAERVDVDKHTVVTGEVSLHKRSVQETEEVTETLRKERAHVDVDGDPEVIDATGVDED